MLPHNEHSLSSHHSVVVIGGGQAGLAMSYCLKQSGIEHVVVEKNRVAHEWHSRRWDTFCLVTPNWQCRLPGFPYAGPDPQGFMKKDEIVAYLEAYAASFDPPLYPGVAVSGVRRAGALFEISTTSGECTADQVVVATGGYHIPKIPRFAERLPPHIQQLSSGDYRNPHVLPPGDVLVVGTGQSGCQIAEDLHLAGRRVHLCVGGAPRTSRRYRGRDVVEWLDLMGHYRMPVHEHPSKEKVRGKANHYVTGRDGGRDIDLRKFAREGMQLYGRLTDVRSDALHFADDLRKNLDQADASADSIKNAIDVFIEQSGTNAPAEPRYTPVWTPEVDVRERHLASLGVSTVIWSMGFQADYRFIDVPLFDGKGYPTHQRGVTSEPGMYFLGLPWLYTWGSGRFSGVADDAAYLVTQIEARERHHVRRATAPSEAQMARA